MSQRHADDAKRYFERHGYRCLPDLPPPDPALKIVVVIPALAEPDVVGTLESLAAARRPAAPVEILLVVNAAETAPAEIQSANEKCLADATAWCAGLAEPRFRCHLLDYRDLPASHAGVGLARKLGMDCALSRLVASADGRGLIVNLDADCRVDASYLEAIGDFFAQNPTAIGATICFEHPLVNAEHEVLPAIIDYELHLRCYKQGLALAGSSYASHTVGSAMAVRSEIYAQEGGMNRRAAGEDFYFINKLLKRGRVGEINNTMVRPSARISKRVPFGTGAAMLHAVSQVQTSYAAAVYPELQSLLNEFDELVRENRPVHADFAPFLEASGFDSWLRKTQANVSSRKSLATQLGRWFDGFRTMKFINWLTETRYARVPVADAARDILVSRGHIPAEDTPGLLQQFRQLDRCRSGVPPR